MTTKKLNLDTDAKFRVERGIDPLSIQDGLNKAAILIKEICGGEISKIDVQKIETFKAKIIKFDPNLFEKIIGFKISTKEIFTILLITLVNGDYPYCLDANAKPSCV